MAKKQASPARKRVPIRTCVICREARPKRELARLVRVPEGFLKVDPTGKLPGRGAYLCSKSDCWRKAARGSVLEKALRAPLSEEDRALLEALAAERQAVERIE